MSIIPRNTRLGSRGWSHCCSSWCALPSLLLSLVSMYRLVIGERSGGSAGRKAEKSEPREECLPIRRELLLRNCFVMIKDASANIWARKTWMLNIGMFRSKIFSDYLNIGDLKVQLRHDTNFSLAGQPNQMFCPTGRWELGLPQRYASWFCCTHPLS